MSLRINPKGKSHVLKNGNVVTLKNFPPPTSRPQKPKPRPLRKGSTTNFQFGPYNDEAYDQNSQDDQTFGDIIGQFLKQKGNEDDLEDFLEYVHEHGPRKSNEQLVYNIKTLSGLTDCQSRAGAYCKHYSTVNYTASTPGHVLEANGGGGGKSLKVLKDASSKQYRASKAANGLTNGGSSSPNSATHSPRPAADELDHDDSLPANNQQYFAAASASSFGVIQPNYYDPSTSKQCSSQFGGLQSQTPFTNETGQNWPQAHVVTVTAERLFYRETTGWVDSGYDGSRDGSGWTSFRTRLSLENGLKRLYFVDPATKYGNFVGYYGDPSGSGCLYAP